jgi:hypothetical protein
MRILAAVAVLLAFAPAPLRAQADTAFYSASAGRWVVQFTIASANVLISGVTAGVTQELKGGSFRDGFTRGALGGLAIYAGKRIAVERFYGAGLVGREVASVGASMVRNASDGIGTFDRVVLPVGLVRVYWHKNQPVVAKVDAIALGWTISGMIEPELKLDASQSLSFGVPTFRTRGKIIDLGDSHVGGVVKTGIIFLSDVPAWGQNFLQRTWAHERVHTLQMDQIFLTLNEPHDDRLLRVLPGGSALNRWVDLNLSSELLQILSRTTSRHGDRPWEMEAIYLTR